VCGLVLLIMSSASEFKDSSKRVFFINVEGAVCPQKHYLGIQETRQAISGFTSHFSGNDIEIHHIKKDGLAVASFWDIAKAPGVYKMIVSNGHKGGDFNVDVTVKDA
jgi:hypothetical protein